MGGQDIRTVAVNATGRAHAERQVLDRYPVKELWAVRRDKSEDPRNGRATYLVTFEERVEEEDA